MLLDTKQTSNDLDDSSSSDEIKESGIKLSRFSSKIKADIPDLATFDIIKSILFDLIINNSVDISIENEKSRTENGNLNTNNNNTNTNENSNLNINKLPSSTNINTEAKSTKQPAVQIDDDDSDDEYFAQMEARNRRLEQGSRVMSVSNASVSKFSSKFIETTKVRVYLLNTQNYQDLPVGINDTIRDLKQCLIKFLEKDRSGKYKFRYNIIEAFELRMIEEDDDDDILPNMEFPAYDDKMNIMKSKNDTLAFVEKINFNPETDQSYMQNSILGSVVKDSETVCYIMLICDYIFDLDLLVSIF